MNEALLMALYVVLIVLVVSLIVLVFRLIYSLNKIDYLVDDLTKKSKSLDGLFSVLDVVTTKVNYVSETIASGLLAFAGRIFGKKKDDDEEEE